MLRLRLGLRLGLGFLAVVSVCIVTVESRCSRGCDLALGSYYVWGDSNLSFIGEVMNVGVAEIASYNPDEIPSHIYVQTDVRINIPFRCECINSEFLGRVFRYSVRSVDTYDRIATLYYSNLTTEAWVQTFNSYGASSIPEDATINVTVNCSCGDSRVSMDYGLFITYPLRTGDTLESVASAANLSTALLRSYNRNANFSAGSGLVYIPGKDKNGNYPSLKSSTGLSGGVIAGISIAGVAGALILAVCIYFGIYRKKKVEDKLLPSATEDHLLQGAGAPGNALDQATDSTGIPPGAFPGIRGRTVDKSLEFSCGELALATDNFNIANKIGQGGFGSVYYAELRGVKAAIKKMDMQASKEFLAELKVLTRVHHKNLVGLIGYCVEGSLFLVYEYIENGNLNQHLRGSGREALPWSTRVQIALDSARGLEYIHEHTVPVYIHRDIKSANILIDKNFHGKVADFGLTKLTDIGSASLPSRLVGTFGYMSPEYGQYGDVSPKLDVYAFGVVLYELISAKEAIVKPIDSMADSMGLVALFNEVLSQPDPREDLAKLVDPRLGDGYPLDSVLKMAQLAKACTQVNPQLRPSMRSIVVTLMTLSSSTDLWNVDSLYKNQALVNQMSGRLVVPLGEWPKYWPLCTHEQKRVNKDANTFEYVKSLIPKFTMV